ncbi:helix-turn-helix domain-containing protein [Priestia flexa]|uniref:helix-turn-helix domain-containing protein n=1 Tax=Priestia flexa TaxID=86664 RepID=UPI00047400B3|nr:helix-turn-helix transcriptional regulator [Priestia flexa]
MQKKIHYGECLLKKYLRKTGMTQARLSELTGISPTKISDYINGRHDMSFTTAVRIARVIGCHADDLYEWEER